jgi:hypothetical protein
MFLQCFFKCLGNKEIFTMHNVNAEQLHEFMIYPALLDDGAASEIQIRQAQLTHTYKNTTLTCVVPFSIRHDKLRQRTLERMRTDEL